MFGDDFWSSIKDNIIEAWYDFCTWIVQQMLIYASNTLSDVVEFLRDGITETPQSWNPELFATLQNVTNAAILPIAIGIMAIILCYDLITACIDRNNFKDFDISIFFQFIIKAWIAIYLINNVFTIVGGLFEIGADIADTALGTVLTEANSMGDFIASEEFRESLREFNGFDLVLSFWLALGVFIVSLAMIIIVMVVTAGRMIEILITISAAPIPFATMTNKEWSSVGFSYLKTILALALQAFFIVITLAIYIVLFNINIANAMDNVFGLTEAMIKWLCYGIICCFMLIKTGSIAKSICNAH